jgi:L-ascorbate metabolism protein UlaG (beta-lactamase superfamily)
MMEILWLGHSCFRLKGRDITILTDPHDRSSGYSLGRISADVVTVSHDAPDHSNLAAVDGDPRVIDGPGEYEVAGALITGIATQRGAKNGDRARNTAYLIEMDDVTVCHLGDLGSILTPEQVELMNMASILLIPVGGKNTINAAQAAEVVSQIEPRIVVPMHFKTESSVADLDPSAKFLREMGITDSSPQPKLSVSRGSLPEETTVVLLDYRR